MQIELEMSKSFISDYWKYVVIFALAFLLFRSCGVNDDLKIVNKSLKKDVKEYLINADKSIAENNALKDKLAVLEQQKQKVKTEIVYIENKTKSDVKKVPALNTKRIANYYQERYKLPITITQYGVSLSDTIAKKNIIELIEKDGCFQGIELVKTQLQLEEKKGVVKDTIIGNITKSNISLHRAIFAQDKIINNVEKSLRKEKVKKTFWQVATGAVIVGASYLLIVSDK